MTRGTNNAGDKGTSGQNVPKSPKGPKTKKSKFRMESEQEKISKSKLRMETREDKLNRARKKLEGKKPPKPRGPVRRAFGAAGWSAHGFVDLCQYFGHKKLKVHADFFNSSSSFCWGVI